MWELLGNLFLIIVSVALVLLSLAGAGAYLNIKELQQRITKLEEVRAQNLRRK